LLSEWKFSKMMQACHRQRIPMPWQIGIDLTRHSHILLILSAIVTFLLADAAMAQKCVSPFSGYTHEAWQTKEGLPQNSVNAIIQSRDGYIWFGTQEGLVRFDGVRFVVFDKVNTKGLLANIILSLCQARDGTLWIGTDGGGATKFHNGTFVPLTTKDGLSDNSVRSIVEDHAGVLWFGTSNGLTRLKDGKCAPWSEKLGLTYSWINTMLVDRQGALWVGTNGGGLCSSDKGGSSAMGQASLWGNVVMSMTEDREGNLWVGAEKGTLTRASNGAGRTFSLNGVRGAISALLNDRQGSTWVGTEDGVLAQFVEPDSLIYFERGGGAVLSMIEDKEGNVWVGRYAGGLHRITKGKFATYSETDGLTNDFVQVLSAGRDGSVWIGTKGGLNRFSRNTVSACTLSDGTPIEEITALHSAQDGTLWIGTSYGLARLKDGSIRSLFTSRGMPQQTVRGIDEDRAGNLWLATRQGLLFSSHPGRGNPEFVPYTDSAGTLREPLWGVHVARRGNALWISTVASGLIRIALDKVKGKETRYTTRDGLSTNVIRSMYEDDEGTMWFGTYAGGLIRFKDDRFAIYTVADGLFDDNVFSILEDTYGNLWMSCNRGVFRANKGALNDFTEGRIKSISCVSYGVSDGMKTFECNGGSQPSGCMSADGRLWFATVKGVAVIDPAHVEPNAMPPPVVIERATIDRREITTREETRVEPGSGELEFTYTALSFAAPEKVRFKYRLEGFDEQWVDAVDRRLAYYTNIPPGKYTFRVIACNNDGLWNEAGASFTFSLAPHYYQTLWFYVLSVLLIALLGSLGYHFYRTYKDREQIASRLEAQLAQAELQVLKMQLQPHFLFNTLHAISSLMHKDLDAADEMMSRLGSLLRYTLESDGAQEVALYQELEMLDHYLEIEQIRLADRLSVVKKVPPELLDAQVPNLILQPMVENAIRYGIAPRKSGGHVEIAALQVNDNIRITICDDGPGLPERAKEGVGLSNTRARLKQLYGANQRFAYANRSEGGVCVTLELPLRIGNHGIRRAASQNTFQNSHDHS
jgi:ligand-binding sensor domain-containing protein/anti-sigma regulatory factor (Ser/Thr protein kinase)